MRYKSSAIYINESRTIIYNDSSGTFSLASGNIIALRNKLLALANSSYVITKINMALTFRVGEEDVVVCLSGNDLTVKISNLSSTLPFIVLSNNSETYLEFDSTVSTLAFEVFASSAVLGNSFVESTVYGFAWPDTTPAFQSCQINYTITLEPSENFEVGSPQAMQ